MLSKLQARLRSEEKGFTLVELLVVILIIGILAAIAIPSFLSQTDKAKDADVKSAVRNAQTAAETFNVDNEGSYAGMTIADLKDIEPTLAQYPDADWTVSSTADTYSVRINSPEVSATQYFQADRAATGVVTRTCDTEGEGACPDDGTW